MPEIIRQGDPTSHGGKVLEGSISDICHGKPIAYIGHKVSCPQCKGTFPIVEGAMTTTFYGKGVALAGMKTACGAALIATQFTDIVEWGGSAAAGPRSAAVRSAVAADVAQANIDERADSVSEERKEEYALRFQAIDPETSKPVPDTPYLLTRADGSKVSGVTNKDGLTEAITAAEPEKVGIHFIFVSPLGKQIAREELV